MKSIGLKIKQLRTEKRITAEDLAAKLGKSQSQISHWELGRNNMTIDMLQKIADIFKVPITYFFDGDDKKHATAIEKNLIEGEEVSKWKEIAQEMRIENKILKDQLAQYMEIAKQAHIQLGKASQS